MQFSSITAAVLLSAVSLSAALPFYEVTGRIVTRDNHDIDCINNYGMKSNCGLEGDQLADFDTCKERSIGFAGTGGCGAMAPGTGAQDGCYASQAVQLKSCETEHVQNCIKQNVAENGECPE